MRVATWNINGLRSRLDFLLHWLRAREPDVVGLQELKLEDDQFPELELRAEGYQAVVHGQKAWNGVAILSREPAEVLQRGLPGQEELGARLITARVGDLEFSTVYVPNGKSVDHPDFPLKLGWLDDLQRYWKQAHPASSRAVLCGDFNLCPAPIDSWDEKRLHGRIFHTEQERRRFRGLLGTGLRDAFRELNPEEQKFSWWDYRGGAFHREMGLRIDLLLATAPVMERAERVWIDRDYRKKQDGLTPSDHAPVIADLTGR